jgi:hypothetical protein
MINLFERLDSSCVLQRMTSSTTSYAPPIARIVVENTKIVRNCTSCGLDKPQSAVDEVDAKWGGVPAQRASNIQSTMHPGVTHTKTA